MKISELINQLETLKSTCGELEIEEAITKGDKIIVKREGKAETFYIIEHKDKPLILKEFFINSEENKKGITIGEKDTFILSQLLVLHDLRASELLFQVSSIEKNNVIFFQLMDDETKKTFLDYRDTIVNYLTGDEEDLCTDDEEDMYLAFDTLLGFVIKFIKDCLKRAGENVK